jgi:hypothetical protein
LYPIRYIIARKISQSANLWFCEERNLEVLIEVNPKAADYFKRRKIFPTQEIREEKPDGTLIVSLRVGHFGKVRETLKTWLPNFRIVAPELSAPSTPSSRGKIILAN